jgi:3-hydroxyisobutyrate dehydrogenase
MYRAAAADQLALCVVSEADVRQILFERGALAAMRRGALLVAHSTISPRACKDLADPLRAQVAFERRDAKKWYSS